jgi:nucleoside-diphosphate-sugar epimerase
MLASMNLHRIFGPARPPKKDAPTILITGGLGFIFSHVTEYYVQKGWNVVVIDNLSEGSHPEVVDGSFVFHKAHMADASVIDLIVREQPDFLVHAAAITDVDYSVREPLRTLRKNELGSLHALEACRKLPNLKKFIYVSTDEVYGECEHHMREDEMLAPRNPYSCSKAFGSLMRLTYENTYPELAGRTAETRFCNIFGPRQDPAKILAALKKSMDEGHSIPLHQEGKGYREYLYVKNIPPALDLILEKGTGVYNVTLNDGYTVKDLIQKAEEVTGRKVTTHPSERPGMDMRYQMDPSRMQEELKWKPTYTFEEGLLEYLKPSTDN